MAERLALYLQDGYPLREAIKLVQYAELRGFEAVWQGQRRSARDILVSLAAYGAVTTRIKLGAGVLDIWTRSALSTAVALLSLDDLAPDRVLCGFGIGSDQQAQRAGIVRHKPLLSLRETANAVQRLLAGERVSLRGEHVRLDDAQLDMPPERQEARQVPIYIAATGPNVVALAGEIADGLVMNYLVSPDYTLSVLEELARGAKQAQRSLNAIDRPQLIMVSVDRDRQLALDRARRVVAQYLISQPRVMRASGVDPMLIDDVIQMAHGQPEAIMDVARLVPDSVVQLVTASGSPDEVRAKVAEYRAAGATSAVLYPLGDPRAMIDLFTDRFLS